MGFAGWSTVIATWVGIVGAGAGGWTALEQQQAQADKEYAQAVKEYELQEAQFNAEIKATYLETFKMFEIFSRSDQLAAREKIYDYMADPSSVDLKLTDVFVYFDFFDALQICVESGICDMAVSIELFKPYAVEVWNSMHPEVLGYRELGNPKFGLGVEWLAMLPEMDEATEDTGSFEEVPVEPTDAETALDDESVADPDVSDTQAQ
jgi:hypothetical protein